MRRRSILVVASVTAMLVALLGAPSPGAAPTVQRVAGPDRVATAVAVSQRATSDGAAVVLARADDHADALTGAPLAHLLDAPLLLTASAGLSPATRDEIVRRGSGSAVLLGGERALSPQIEADLRAIGVDEIDRLAGVDRYDTARRVAERVGGDRVYVVQGADPDPQRGWPDAVSVAPLAARQGRPVLLVERDRLPEATRQALAQLDVTAATVVGGHSAVSTAVADEVADHDRDGAAEVQVDRVAGATRYDTSRLLADRAVAAGADPADVWVATGHGWPDALAAGPVVADVGGVLLLVDGRHVLGSPETWAWIADHASDATSLVLVGGRAAIADHVATSAAWTLERRTPPTGGAFDQDLAYTRAITLADAGPRPAGSAGDAAARAWLIDQLRAAGWTVVEEPFALPQGGSSANVVAFREGDPRGGTHVVLGGHLDTVADSPGANDNASGIGAVIALAHELVDEPTPAPLVLVGFGAEEFQPSEPRRHHVGSEVYAAQHAGTAIGMISIDMIGDGDSTCVCWYDEGPRTMTDRLMATARALSIAAYEQERGDISDHGPFAVRGVPAAFLYSGLVDYYHSPQDTSDRIVASDIGRTGTLVLTFVRGLVPEDAGGLR